LTIRAEVGSNTKVEVPVFDAKCGIPVENIKKDI
jgi:hypothetical protein